MNEQWLRDKFLNYFSERNHKIVPSSSLVPANDPTLLFTNAGMVQFKNIFLGLEKPKFKRAVSVQKCVRAGGKHNDLDEVGRTARHHTFFEMLGNFSFGDYFKKEAMEYAWDFLINELKLPKEKLYITIYEKDSQSRALWQEICDISDDRIVSLGEKDNFWSMGETGPCGPCSEIFYDKGEAYTCDAPECALGVCDCDRFVEIWNLVFMEYNKDKTGKLNPLPNPSIDTGMGLERVVAVLNHVDTNYDIPIFKALIGKIEELSGKKYTPDLKGFPFRVVADHSRTCCFLIADGVLPSNEGRGYVLRRIIRRAARFGLLLGIDGSFIYKIVPLVVELMGAAYPEIVKQEDFIAKVIKIEEDRFGMLLEDGLEMVSKMIKIMQANKVEGFSGQEIFNLYDTYGFPVDLVADIAEEENLDFDEKGFKAIMEKQKQKAREDWQKKSGQASGDDLAIILKDLAAVNYMGYDNIEINTKVVAIVKDGNLINSLNENEEGYAVLKETVLYPEGGGQIGDEGLIINLDTQGEITVTDTQKLPNNVIVNKIKATKGVLNKNDKVLAKVDLEKRQDIARNHSATHLLHKALRQVLGEQAKQAGSAVDAKGLRFDFTSLEGLTSQQVLEIESIVNNEILKNNKIKIKKMSYDDALEKGAIALFNEKYDDKVRVVKIGDSIELCGGIHCKYTGEIGPFKILSESGIGAGNRRIEAITGKATFKYWQIKESQVNKIAEVLKANVKDVYQKVKILIEQEKEIKREKEKLQAELNKESISDINDDIIKISDKDVIIKRVDAQNMNDLRDMMDMIKEKTSEAVIILAGATPDNKVNIVATVKGDIKGIHAGEIVKAMAIISGGGGGGRPDMAQAGGKDPSKIQEALAEAKKIVENQLGEN